MTATRYRGEPDITARGRARGWYTVPETAALTGYTESSLYTLKTRGAGVMANAWRAPDRRVRVPYQDVMTHLSTTATYTPAA